MGHRAVFWKERLCSMQRSVSIGVETTKPLVSRAPCSDALVVASLLDAPHGFCGRFSQEETCRSFTAMRAFGKTTCEVRTPLSDPMGAVAAVVITKQRLH